MKLLWWLRIIAVILLAFALTEPGFETTSETSRATILVDISESMNEGLSNQYLNQIKDLASNNIELDVYPFAGETAPIALQANEVTKIEKLRDSWSRLDTGATNLELAISTAIAAQNENILLLSDAYETKGSVSTYLNSSSQRKIFAFAPDSEEYKFDALRLSKLHAPLIAALEKSVEIRSTISNSTEKNHAGQLVITHGEKTLFDDQVTILAQQNALFKVKSDPSKEGTHAVTATFRPADRRYPATSQTIYISGQERSKVLLLSNNEGEEQLLKSLLQEQSFKLESISNPRRSMDMPDLSRFSAILMNNVPSNLLPTSFPRKLEAYVREGGGAIMIGGNRSFGLGGYKDTPIEKAMPVLMLPPQTQKKRLNVAVSLLLDKSRSMSNDDKIYYAKSAATSVINSLKPDDYIEVIGFDSAPFVVVRMGQLQKIKGTALDRVTRLFPAGRTNLLPALHEARRSMTKVPAARKHVIILTDGKIPDAENYYLELIGQLRDSGCTVSTVMLGDDIDTAQLELLAREGGGAFHQTTDARSLAKIFLDDIRVSTGERTLKERKQFFVRRGSGELKSTTVKAYPPLKGYVQTKVKRKANLELVVSNGEKVEPLLASWKYGQGKALAFTSDSSGRWSSFWANWPQLATFWSDIIDTLTENSSQKENIRFDLRYYLEAGRLQLDLAVYSNKANAGVRAELERPDQSKDSIIFEQQSVGRFLSQVDRPSAGKYTLRLFVGDQKLTPVTFALSGDLFGEQKGKGFNRPLLEELVAANGGFMNPSAEDFLANAKKEVHKTSFAPWLIALAAFLLLLEVLFREIGRRELFRIFAAN